MTTLEFVWRLGLLAPFHSDKDADPTSWGRFPKHAVTSQRHVGKTWFHHLVSVSRTDGFRLIDSSKTASTWMGH